MKSTSLGRDCFLLLSTCLLVWAMSADASQAAIRAVAFSGDLDPRTGEPFAFFETPVMNNNGEVAFQANLDDPNGSIGIWSEGDGIGLLRNVALVGDTAPGSGGMAFLDFVDTQRNLYLNDLGDVAFKALMDDFSTEGIWTDRDRPTSDLTKVVIDGDPAPGLNAPRDFRFGAEYRGLADIHSGIAFFSSLTLAAPPDNFPSSGVFNEGFAVILDNVAEIADFAPGSFNPATGTGAQFDLFNAPTINNAGHVAFSAETLNSGIGSLGSAGVWSTSPSGTFRDVALQGEAAPGTATTFGILFGKSAVINNDGDIAFTATLSGLIGGNLRDGVWVERDGTVEKVMFESETAPGTGSTFENLTSDPLLDGSGNALFHASLLDGRDGLWMGEPGGTLDWIALEGEPAPGTSANFLNINDIAVNDSGQVAFLAQLDDFSDALYATDPSGALRKIVAEGDVIDVDGDIYEVVAFDFHGLTGLIPPPGAGLGNGFGDTGEVAFTASLTDPNTFESFEAVLVSDKATTIGNVADFDGDGDVDGSDFLRWQRGYDPACTNCSLGDGDADDDMDVDNHDLAIWESQYGLTGLLSATAVSVPEPPTLALLGGLAIAGLLTRRRPGCELITG